MWSHHNPLLKLTVRMRQRVDLSQIAILSCPLAMYLTYVLDFSYPFSFKTFKAACINDVVNQTNALTM